MRSSQPRHGLTRICLLEDGADAVWGTTCVLLGCHEKKNTKDSERRDAGGVLTQVRWRLRSPSPGEPGDLWEQQSFEVAPPRTFRKFKASDTPLSSASGVLRRRCSYFFGLKPQPSPDGGAQGMVLPSLWAKGEGACPVAELRFWQNCVTHKLLLSIQCTSVIIGPHPSLKKVTFYPTW